MLSTRKASQSFELSQPARLRSSVQSEQARLTTRHVPDRCCSLLQRASESTARRSMALALHTLCSSHPRTVRRQFPFAAAPRLHKAAGHPMGLLPPCSRPAAAICPVLLLHQGRATRLGGRFPQQAASLESMQSSSLWQQSCGFFAFELLQGKLHPPRCCLKALHACFQHAINQTMLPLLPGKPFSLPFVCSKQVGGQTLLSGRMSCLYGTLDLLLLGNHHPHPSLHPSTHLLVPTSLQNRFSNYQLTSASIPDLFSSQIFHHA